MTQPTLVKLPTAAESATHAHSASAASSTREVLRHTPSALVPLLLTTLAVLGFLGLQVMGSVQDRQNLQATHVAQQNTVDNAGKLRTSLDALAADTQRMADAGNPNAALLVAELRKRGVTINPGAPAATGAAGPATAPR